MKRKENVLKHELNLLLEKEESYWMQRSRVQWLKEGDKKVFFHGQASHRKRRNITKEVC